MNLFLHYFKHKNEIRRNELDFCTKKNINDCLFEKVYILLENEEDKQDWMEKENVIIENINKRMKFKNIFEYVNYITNKEDINVFCNLDIYFDNTIEEVKKMNDDDFITLTRWNIDVKNKKATFYNLICSQDTWIWKGKVDLDKIDLNFDIGKPGCDNAICGVFHEAGYRVLNPSLKVKTYHLHSDTKRDYTDKDVVRRKLYFLYPNDSFKESGIKFWKDCTKI